MDYRKRVILKITETTVVANVNYYAELLLK